MSQVAELRGNRANRYKNPAPARARTRTSEFRVVTRTRGAFFLTFYHTGEFVMSFCTALPSLLLEYCQGPWFDPEWSHNVGSIAQLEERGTEVFIFMCITSSCLSRRSFWRCPNPTPTPFDCLFDHLAPPPQPPRFAPDTSNTI